MSNPLSGLRELINAKPAASVGSVVRDNGTVVLVSTPEGVKEIPKVGVNVYASGDSIRMFNGVAVGKVKNDNDLPRYYV